MRLIHRYLGYFLSGIMAVYAVTGIILVYRADGLMREEVHHHEQFKPRMNEHFLGKTLKMKFFKVEKEDAENLYFKGGTYNKVTGVADYKVMEYPYLLNKMISMHKATTKDPLHYFNVFFGISLFLFVLTSLFMFSPKTKAFRVAMLFVVIGLAMGALRILF